MSRIRVLVAALLASSAVGLAGAAPALSQIGGPRVSINPTEGRIGTQITATITDCTPPTTGDGQARLDFSFPDLTPANTVFFAPAADGTATVTIEAMEKEGQSEDRNYAEVVVSQCGNGGFFREPFTIYRYRSKPAVVRGNTWFLAHSLTAGTADFSFQYGDSEDFPLFGDWNGTGTDGPGVVRGGTWYLRNTNTTGVADVTFRYGNWDDLPIAGRWAPGNAADTVGVVRGGTWYLRNTNTTGVADVTFRYGNWDDFPIVGDWDGDGVDTPGVVRGNTWYLRNTNTTGVADVVFTYGNSTDFPIVGDWQDNGKDGPGVVRGNVRYLRYTNTTGVADVVFAYGNRDDFHLVWNSVPPASHR